MEHKKNLTEWLEYIQSISPNAIELGLERVKMVAEKLGLLPASSIVITVAGTNGKGSSIAGLEAIYIAAGYRVGAYTSPYLFRYQEQVRVQHAAVTDDDYCDAFEQIERARQSIRLTPFEFNTLAALVIFQRYQLDIYLLEVGLGGRLDAVNIIDADAAIISSIDLDHTEWLGDTRELIAIEKAGVLRRDKPAICGDINPPHTLLEYTAVNQTPLFCLGKDFHITAHSNHWDWLSSTRQYYGLPQPSLALRNMATVLMTIEALQHRLPVRESAIRQGLMEVKLPGRIQVITGDVTEIYDVSHNPASAALLAEKVKQLPRKGKIIGVFSMLADKDIVTTLEVMKKYIDQWQVAELAVDRAMKIDKLVASMSQVGISKVTVHSDLIKAYQAAKQDALPGDTLLIFGSFHTVAAVASYTQAI